jgi:hypothetical protein
VEVTTGNATDYLNNLSLLNLNGADSSGTVTVPLRVRRARPTPTRFPARRQARFPGLPARTSDSLKDASYQEPEHASQWNRTP